VIFHSLTSPVLPAHKEPNMIIVGCDYHPSFQQIAFVDTETGELKEQRLVHREGAEEFYRALAARAKWRSSTSARYSVLKKNLTPPTLSETPGYDR
jgi:hypothetical protein